MYENKMKELEREGEKERAERTELKRKLKEAAEREEKALRAIHALEDQVPRLHSYQPTPLCSRTRPHRTDK